MIGSLALILSISAAVIAAKPGQSNKIPSTYPDLSQCSGLPLQYSCENTTAFSNSCCSIAKGGLVLQTQFWDTYTGFESQGQKLPKDSWTIHGLWPDNCDGSFDQYCDLSRQYDPKPSKGVPAYNGSLTLDKVISSFGRFDLLDYMNKYWPSQGSLSSTFWAHEFSKHATCTSTFDIACYGTAYKQYQDVVDFFDAVVRAFKMYPTYSILAASGIIPCNTTTYKLADIQGALKAQTGAIPYLGCSNNGTVLSEVWYFNHVLGSEQFGTYKHVDSTTPSSCKNNTGIHYYERTRSSEREVRW